VPVGGQINRVIAFQHVTLLTSLFTLVGLLATESKFQHLAPTVRATRKPPAMAPKRANPKADEAAKAALLAARKGKALALTQSTAPAALKDNRSHPQASPHWKARTSPRMVKSSASRRKNSYSCAPCASRTAISRGRKKYWRPSASACPH
jgi:hypothetical protein